MEFISEYDKEIAAQKERIIVLNTHISRLEGERRSREFELGQKHTEELKKQEDGMNAIINNLKDENDKLKKENDNIKEENYNIKVIIDNLKEENKGINIIVAERDKSLEEITSKYNNIKRKLFDQITKLGERILAMDDKVTNGFLTQASTLSGIAEQKNVILSEISKVNTTIEDKTAVLAKAIDDLPDYELITDGLPTEIIERLKTLTNDQSQETEIEEEKSVEEDEPPKEVDPEKLKGLSATAIQVYEKLTEPMTINNAIDLTGIAKATVYRHIGTLLKRGLIKSLGGKPEKFQRV